MNVVVFPEPYGDLVGLLVSAMFLYIAIEIILLHFKKRKLRLAEARTSGLGFLSVVLTTGLLQLWVPFGVAMLAVLGSSLSPLGSMGLGSMGLGVFGWVFGWLVYEFWYWVQHWAAHKVRLLWCIHSPHHAPKSLYMLVGTNHHFLEGAFYLPFFAGFVPALFGVDPLVCLTINIIDSIWGSFLHISDEVVPGGRYGIIGRFMQTPAHHRVHHAKNVRYLDTNYCSITLFWDWALGTLQSIHNEEPPSYGISREVDTGSFWDMHFREFVLLGRDIRSTTSWPYKVGFLFKPPGWQPGDDSQTAAARKRVL